MTPYPFEIVEQFLGDFDEGSFRRENRIWWGSQGLFS